MNTSLLPIKIDEDSEFPEPDVENFFKSLSFISFPSAHDTTVEDFDETEEDTCQTPTSAHSVDRSRTYRLAAVYGNRLLQQNRRMQQQTLRDQERIRNLEKFVREEKKKTQDVIEKHEETEKLNNETIETLTKNLQSSKQLLMQLKEELEYSTLAKEEVENSFREMREKHSEVYSRFVELKKQIHERNQKYQELNEIEEMKKSYFRRNENLLKEHHLVKNQAECAQTSLQQALAKNQEKERENQEIKNLLQHLQEELTRASEDSKSLTLQEQIHHFSDQLLYEKFVVIDSRPEFHVKETKEQIPPQDQSKEILTKIMTSITNEINRSKTFWCYVDSHRQVEEELDFEEVPRFLPKNPENLLKKT